MHTPNIADKEIIIAMTLKEEWTPSTSMVAPLAIQSHGQLDMAALALFHGQYL
jgi:hypothetical protein